MNFEPMYSVQLYIIMLVSLIHICNYFCCDFNTCTCYNKNMASLFSVTGEGKNMGTNLVILLDEVNDSVQNCSYTFLMYKYTNKTHLITCNYIITQHHIFKSVVPL
jgi:hypothetical protein